MAEGQRNSTVASLTGHLLWHGVDPDVTLELLLAWNRVRCRPPLDDAEVAQVLWQALLGYTTRKSFSSDRTDVLHDYHRGFLLPGLRVETIDLYYQASAARRLYRRGPVITPRATSALPLPSALLRRGRPPSPCPRCCGRRPSRR
ncbi:MAG: primase alpha helix C-terminal domain-containing protein [Methyloceanibacter sp.]